MVRRLYKGLDLTLKVAVKLDRVNTLDTFIA